MLEERDPLRAPDAPADISLRLDAIRAGDPSADRGALSRIRQAARQYRGRLRVRADVPAQGDPAALLAAAFPDRVAQRRGEPGSFRLSGGGGARLTVTDPLAKASLLVVAAIELKASSRVRLAARLDPDALPHTLLLRCAEQVETGLDPVTGSFLSRRRRRLGSLVLSDRTETADPALVAQSLVAAVAADGLRPLSWADSARQLQARVALMRQAEPDADWPDLTDDGLAETIQDWLPPYLAGIARLGDLQRLDLTDILRARLPWALAARLDRELPTQLALAGGRAAIDYSESPPLASARAQAFYGLASTPKLADGRIPLRLALLSPAGRPIAVTADLAGFWKGRLGGRAPRHARALSEACLAGRRRSRSITPRTARLSGRALEIIGNSCCGRSVMPCGCWRIPPDRRPILECQPNL